MTLLLQDNYRIYDFVGRDPNRKLHGYRNPDVPQNYLPSADLLRDHFHQCLLRHVKGAGESSDEPQRRFDLRQGGFNLSTNSWWSGSEGKKQLEAEIAAQIWGVMAKNQSESHEDSTSDSSPFQIVVSSSD